MGTEIPWEIRERAEDLYVFGGLTYEQTAKETGVSISQLKRWGEADPETGKPSWTERKREYRTAQSSIKRDTVLLRARMMKKTIQSLNPQDVYAVAAIENMALKMVESETPVADESAPTAEERRIIKTPSDAVDALQEVIEKKIGAMLSSPAGVSLSGIKEMKQALELVEKMKARYEDEETESRTPAIDAKTIQEIEETLGL